MALERAAPPDAIAKVRGLLGQGDRQPSPYRLRPPGSLGARRETLDRAASEWGVAVGSPMVVVEQMVQLRYLLAGSTEGDRLARLVDRAMIHAARAATDELQRAAFSDPLTGCANRRGLERDLERELARCARAELDLAVVALDVDGLKHINDTAGHAAGDQVLLLLVETLRRTLRGLDGVYRVGGDEFIVLLPDASPEAASAVMARVEKLDPPSFTWGVAGVQATGLFDAPALLAAADDQLYERRRTLRGISYADAKRRRAGRSLARGAEDEAQAGATG
jgi:diguanylate cyclase (GGDEF)-like protein